MRRLNGSSLRIGLICSSQHSYGLLVLPACSSTTRRETQCYRDAGHYLLTGGSDEAVGEARRGPRATPSGAPAGPLDSRWVHGSPLGACLASVRERSGQPRTRGPTFVAYSPAGA